MESLCEMREDNVFIDNLYLKISVAFHNIRPLILTDNNCKYADASSP